MVHEATHTDESGWEPGTIHSDTHDYTFNVGVYKGFSKLLSKIFQRNDTEIRLS